MKTIIFSPCFLINGNELFEVTGMDISKLYNNYYMVTKYGTIVHPSIVYEKVNNKLPCKNKHIGGYFELVDFIKENKNEYILLRGFSRAVIQKIFGLVITETEGKKRIKER